MIKKILILLKKIIFGIFIIYGYNILASPLNLFIPINIITISLVTILGMPALLALILIMLVVF